MRGGPAPRAPNLVAGSAFPPGQDVDERRVTLKIGRMIATAIAALALAGVPAACGEDDVEKGAQDVEQGAKDAGSEAKDEAGEVKDSAEKEIKD